MSLFCGRYSFFIRITDVSRLHRLRISGRLRLSPTFCLQLHSDRIFAIKINPIIGEPAVILAAIILAILATIVYFAE